MLQTRPPNNPNIENCQNGSEPDEPNTAPKVGINKVRYVIGNRIINFTLVVMKKATVTRTGTLKATPNSHKSKFESFVSMLLTKMKTELVIQPAKLPSSKILITFHPFISS